MSRDKYAIALLGNLWVGSIVPVVVRVQQKYSGA